MADLVTFQKGQRKDDVTQKYVRKFTRREGVLYVGKAQEKARVMRTERRCSRFTGGTYPWIVESTAMVNHYYFYCVDEDGWRSRRWTTASSLVPKRSKNDANDAAAICEAVTRPPMRFVPTKSEQQQSALIGAASSWFVNARCCRTRSVGIWRSSV